MKTLAYIVFVAMCLAVVAMATVPDDDRCINECTHSVAGDLASFVPGSLKTAVFYTEPHCLYKKVINRWTGQTVAIGCFGNVFNIE